MKKVLIANRGEIAVRIIRACREMGIRRSPSIRTAIEPHCTFGMRTKRIRSVLPPRRKATFASMVSSTAARRSGADAVHPGYGFLAENEAFAAAVRDAGLTFIGPDPEVIALMGNKTAARVVSRSVPVSL